MDNESLDLARSAARVVAEVTARPVLRTEEIRSGVMTHKFAVWSALGEAYVIRFYPPARSDVVNYEPDLVRRCAGHGIEVPEVVADSRTGPRAELHYMIYKRLEGTSLGGRFDSLSAASRQELGRRLARILPVLSQIRFDGTGELVDAWRAKEASWRLFVHSSFLDGLQAVKANGLVEKRLLAGLCELAGQVDLYVTAEANALAWVDISLDNMIGDDQGRLVGLIDFESALAGDPILTLGSCYARYGEHEFLHLITRSWPVPLTETQWRQVYFFAVLRTLRVAKHAAQPLPTGRAREPLTSVFPGFTLAMAKLGTIKRCTTEEISDGQ